MYDVALTVQSCLQAGTDVQVAWLVATDGVVRLDPSEGLAITPGGGRVGSIAGGALNDQVADLAGPATSRVVELSITEIDALIAGLPRPGVATVVVMSARELPIELWQRLVDRVPVGLRLQVEDGAVVASELIDAQEAGTSVANDLIVTSLRPVPTLVVVGGGPIVEAVIAVAAVVGWRTQSYTDPVSAGASVVGLSPVDGLVVVAHDVDVAGTVLMAALSSRVGYIGALGSRAMQRERAAWLRQRGIDDVARIHGPAGLDIGASTPAEIAVSVVAEAIAVRTGARIRAR